MDFVQHRIGTIFAAFFVLLVLAAGRTMYLDVVRGATLRKEGSEEHLTAEAVSPRRGSISDRNGLALAVSEPAQDLSADPYLIRDPLAISKKLAPLLGERQPAVLAKLSERRGFVYLVRALPEAQAEAVLALKIPGVSGTPVMRRVHPRGALAAQVLGIVGTEGKGLTGLEYGQNALLAGAAGERRVVSDALGQPLSISESRPEEPGTNLTLTLDSNIQKRSEEVLAAVGRVFEPKDATAIVMDPRTGALLAVANWPQVNAADPAASSASALADRAVSFAYEPGSTFKVVTVSGALAAGADHAGQRLQRARQDPGRRPHDPRRHRTRRRNALHQRNPRALEQRRRDRDRQSGGRRELQLVGTPLRLRRPHGRGPRQRGTGRGAAAGQVLGLLDGQPPDRTGRARDADPDGQRVRRDRQRRDPAPTAHRQRDRPEGRARAPRTRVISSTTAAEVRRMLQGVLGPGGTASEVSIPGYQLAGKTGTASKIDPATGEYSHTAYVASFIGFAPASDPKLLCAVVVDEPHTGSIFGGTVAAPAFGQIMSFALPYMNVEPG